jgi:hypothetical protein
MSDIQHGNNSIKLFGFEIKRVNSKKNNEKLATVVPPTSDDGEDQIEIGGNYNQGYYLDIDGTNNLKGQIQLINKYRGIAQQTEVDAAIDEIVNESIVYDDENKFLEVNLEKSKLSAGIKTKIENEFEEIYGMLNFGELGYDLFRSWYVDGRLYHHLVVNPDQEKLGIQEIRYIDATKIRKVKKVFYKKDPKTNVDIVDRVDEHYQYEKKPGSQNTAIILSKDSVSYVPSGLLDETRKKVISHLHKGLKPVNQLRMMEDSLVIYRLARAPERRIFYIDVGNLGAAKAEQHMKSIMSRFRNKLVYDATTGLLKDDRKHMSMLEDFWLPRKEGGRGTEISTLPGGENLGQIDDIIYFQKRLYKSLNVPVSRLENESTFNIGRSSEITREEIKFQKFIDRLRQKFSKLFLDILRKQLVLKGIITEEDWDDIKDEISIDYQQDNHFTELKETEILNERLNTLDRVSGYSGEFVSKDWIWREVLKLNEEEIKAMKKEMDTEENDGEADRGADDEVEPQEPKPVPVTIAPSPPTPVPKKDTVEKDKKPDKPTAESIDSKDNFLVEAELGLMEKISDYLDDK